MNPDEESKGGNWSGLLPDSSTYFNEEWFWVLGYGTAAVLLIVANIMMLCSIAKNAFLHTNIHRSLAALSIRHILRAMFGLTLVYTTRWSHPSSSSSSKFSTIDGGGGGGNGSSNKDGLPLVCDVLCSLDTFLLCLPMFLLVAAAVHMFTRYPSPMFGFPSAALHCGNHNQGFCPAAFSHTQMPREPGWLCCLLPLLPILMSGLMTTPIPLLHLTHKLQAVPDKYICHDDSSHMTYDISLFILAFCLPVLLMFFLIFGLLVRRCLHCSRSHCCNSWCKEELVVVLHFLVLTGCSQLMYLPLIDTFLSKMDWSPEWWVWLWLRNNITPHVARAAEMLHGVSLPFLCFFLMPAYRRFCTEPDPDDLRISAARGRQKRIQAGFDSDSGGAVLVGIKKHKSLDLDSSLDHEEPDA